MQKQKIIEIQDEFPDTHFLSYHGKRYPIKYDFFKISSKYFLQNNELLEQNKIIPIFDIDEDPEIDLTDENIEMFINFVQRKKVAINNENVVSLYYLANRFEVTSLINFTKEYLSENHDDLILPILLMHQNDQNFESATYESIISQNLPFYIKDERLFDIKISMLYRILSDYFTKNQKEKENKEIYGFLFKCLDKYGREASSLFAYVDFGQSRGEYLALLLKKYSNIFDFHFINPSMMNAFYLQQSEMIRKDEEDKILYEKKIKMLEDEIEKCKLKHESDMKNVKVAFQSTIEDMKKMIESKDKERKKQDEINQMNLKSYKDEIEKIRSEHSKQLNDLNQKNEREIDSLKNEIKILQQAFQSTVDETKKKIESKDKERKKQDEINQMNLKSYKDEIEKIKSEHNKQLNDLNQKNEREIDSLKNEIKILQQAFQSTIDETKKKIELNNKEIKEKEKFIQNTSDDLNNLNIKSFEYANGHEFEGIFNYLNKESGGNSHLKGIINITSSGDNYNKCYNLIDQKFDEYLNTSPNPNSYVQFDFKDRKVSISKYSLKNKRIFMNKLINWEIVGSNDGAKWTQIDERHIKEWNGGYNVSTYSTQNQEFYKYIRLQLKGLNSSNQNLLFLSSIEFFGKIH